MSKRSHEEDKRNFKNPFKIEPIKDPKILEQTQAKFLELVELHNPLEIQRDWSTYSGTCGVALMYFELHRRTSGSLKNTYLEKALKYTQIAIESSKTNSKKRY